MKKIILIIICAIISNFSTAQEPVRKVGEAYLGDDYQHVLEAVKRATYYYVSKINTYSDAIETTTIEIDNQVWDHSLFKFEGTLSEVYLCKTFRKIESYEANKFYNEKVSYYTDKYGFNQARTNTAISKNPEMGQYRWKIFGKNPDPKSATIMYFYDKEEIKITIMYKLSMY